MTARNQERARVDVSGIILAAGLSTRMGDANKLTTVWNGKPLVRHVAEAALASRLNKVVVVTGHEADEVEAVLPKGCLVAWNGDYAEGMAGSIRCGQYRLQGYGPVMIMLGDMPLLECEHINALMDAFENAQDKAIIVATCNEQWGNPVLFDTSYFTDLKLLDGDAGARSLIERNRDRVVEVEIGPAAKRDFDTQDAFAEIND